MSDPIERLLYNIDFNKAQYFVSEQYCSLNELISYLTYNTCTPGYLDLLCQVIKRNIDLDWMTPFNNSWAIDSVKARILCTLRDIIPDTIIANDIRKLDISSLGLAVLPLDDAKWLMDNNIVTRGIMDILNLEQSEANEVLCDLIYIYDSDELVLRMLENYEFPKKVMTKLLLHSSGTDINHDAIFNYCYIRNYIDDNCIDRIIFSIDYTAAHLENIVRYYPELLEKIPKNNIIKIFSSMYTRHNPQRFIRYHQIFSITDPDTYERLFLESCFQADPEIVNLIYIYAKGNISQTCLNKGYELGLRLGKLPFVEWFHDKGFTPPKITKLWNNRHDLRYKTPGYFEYYLDHFMQRNNITFIEYVINIHGDNSVDNIQCFAKNNSNDFKHNIFLTACIFGSLQVIEWMYNKYDIDLSWREYIFLRASVVNNNVIVKWLENMTIGSDCFQSSAGVYLNGVYIEVTGIVKSPDDPKILNHINILRRTNYKKSANN
jgi:hypothetical protein